MMLLDDLIRMVVPLDDGSVPDLSPVWAELRRRPTALLNPMDLFFEIQRPEYFKRRGSTARPATRGGSVRTVPPGTCTLTPRRWSSAWSTPR